MYLDDDDYGSDEDDDNGYDHPDVDDGIDVGRAPICPSCGVTALPAQLSNVLDSEFVCDNEGCDAYGETM